MSENIFSRNISFWGEEKQEILKNSCILIAGVGGLGCTVSELLIRAGIGKLIIIDNGIIDKPDLNRQILYSIEDLEKAKIAVAAEKLTAIHKQSKVIALNMKIENNPAIHEILNQYNFDGIADCLDNFSSRFALEKLVTDKNFLVHGGVQDDYGQVTTIQKKSTKMLKEIYAGYANPEAPIPVTPAIVCCISSLMVQEIIYNLFNSPKLLNTLLIVELSDFSFFKVKLKK